MRLAQIEYVLVNGITYPKPFTTYARYVKQRLSGAEWHLCGAGAFRVGNPHAHTHT
jgi:hypothetical protein